VIDDRETFDEVEARPRSNRGFWIIAVALLTASAIVLVAIFANRPLVGAIAHSEKSLRDALAQAERIRGDGGTFAQATSEDLSGDGLTFIPGNQVSDDPATVSVHSTDTTWAAAVAARPNACFYIMQVAGEATRYGSGTTCTGDAALSANADGW